MTPADWDAALFRAIHHGMHQRWLDPIMVWLTDPGPWKIPLLVLIGALFLLKGRRGLIGVVVLALTIAAADQLSSHVLKPVFRRARPSETLRDTLPLFGVRHSYSFPSSHATNFFAAAPVISAVFPQGTVVVYVAAAAVSFSRVYVGDHYPLDVIVGAALGLGLGFVGRRAYRRLVRTLLQRRGVIVGEVPDPVKVTPRGERAPSGGP